MNWAPVVAAIIAALVAVVGYAVTQFANRQDRKAKTYAEALAAVTEYQELPYLVLRRAASDAATRAALAQRQSEVMAKLGFYQAWVQVDSAKTGDAYYKLVRSAREQCRQHMATAWTGEVLESDTQMFSQEVPFRGDLDAQRADCLLAMQRELRPWGFLEHRSTRRRLAERNLDRIRRSANQDAS